jgi:hypothetical protein
MLAALVQQYGTLVGLALSVMAVVVPSLVQERTLLRLVHVSLSVGSLVVLVLLVVLGCVSGAGFEEVVAAVVLDLVLIPPFLA